MAKENVRRGPSLRARRAACIALVAGALFGCAVTSKAKFRSHAKTALEICLRYDHDSQWCFNESKKLCRSYGLESSCAIDAFW